MQYIENRTFDEIQIGDSAHISRRLKARDIELFAVMSGDVNPAHVDEEYARSDMFHKVIAHGMWGGALISAVLGTELPGPGTIYLDQDLKFRHPVGIGDTVTVTVTVAEKDEAHGQLVLDCQCTNQDGEVVIEGKARVIAPTQKVRRPRAVLPEVHLHERGARYRDLIAATHDLPAIPTAVVHPCDELSLGGRWKLPPRASSCRCWWDRANASRRPRNRQGWTWEGPRSSTCRTATPPPNAPSRWFARARPRR